MEKQVFQEFNLGGISVENRIVRSATGELMADSNGYVTDRLINMYSELSEGNIGLIITGLTEIIKGTMTHTLMQISDDSHIEGLKKLTDTVHNNSGKIMMQLVHHGAQIHGKPDYTTLSPSAIGSNGTDFTQKEMTKQDLETIIEEFGNAALRAKKAGFDGVQVHGAHGYLLSRFLTPYYNRRKDEYGGSIENRTRITLDVYKNIREKCGNDFPIFIKMNVSDFMENDGLSFEDSKKAAKIFSDIGFDAIELSGGILIGEHSPARTKIKTIADEGYHRDYASLIAEEIDTPIILVGGYRHLESIEDVLKNSKIEAVSMCRPFIREPKLVKKWLDGNKEKSKCISCNKCFNPNGSECIFNKK